MHPRSPLSLGQDLTGVVFALAFLALAQAGPRVVGPTLTGYVLLALVLGTTGWQLRRQPRTLILLTVALAVGLSVFFFETYRRGNIVGAAIVGIIFATVIARPLLTAWRQARR